MVRRGRSQGSVMRSNPLGISPMRAAKMALKLASNAKSAYDKYKSKSRSRSFKSAKSSISNPANDALNERGGSSTGKVTVRKRKDTKRVKNRKPKSVVVSKQFKQKVNKALLPKQVSGRWEQISYSSMRVSDFLTSQQCVYVPGLGSSGDSGLFFDDDAYGAVGNVADYIHQLSVLWNGKTDDQSFRNVVTDGTIGRFTVINPSFGLNQQPTNPSINPVDLKFTVRSHSESYRLRNNSKRTWTIDIYLCRPKKPTSEYPGMIQTTTVQPIPLTPESPLVGSPLQSWRIGIDMEYQLAHQAVNDITQFSLFQKPTSIPYFNTCWKTQLTTVILEPGQVYDYYIQGPTNLDIDTKKCWNSGFFRDLNKFSVIPMFVCRLDMVGPLLGTSRYPTRGQQVGVGSILVERRYITKLSMPDIVGGPIAVGGLGTQYTHQNMSRRFRNFYKNYQPEVTDPVKIEEEVPNFEEVA